jgi:CBS domain-containing membrane protein
MPTPVILNRGKRLRVAVGAGLGVLIAAWLSRWLGGASSAQPWLVAPLGASAVLVFAQPASPLAHPWAVVVGNTCSALVGVLCVHASMNVALAPWFVPGLAPALAVGGAVILMFSTRSLHPPGGATALLVVLGGVTDPRFALFPVFVNSLLLALAGLVYNNLMGNPYPVRHKHGNPAH